MTIHTVSAVLNMMKKMLNYFIIKCLDSLIIDCYALATVNYYEQFTLLTMSSVHLI